MGKYDDLISHINRDVSSNGKKQNTGAKVNSVLNEMVSVLGDGFRIAGEITPSSPAPTDPENGMCYIAKTAGTYTNFDSLVVGDDEIAFIRYIRTSWEKMGWRRNDVGVVIGTNASQDSKLTEEQMAEVRKDVAFIVHGDKDYVQGRIFVKDRLESGYYIFYAAPKLSVDEDGDMVFNQGVLTVSATASNGGYQYDVAKNEQILAIKDNVLLGLSSKQDALTFDSAPTANSTNPVTSGGVATAISGFVTASVNNLVNYYLKSETYTKAEVEALIGAIQQFHYEIYPTLPASGESNVLYLIGPTGDGTDKYEEYVYANNDFTKIGDTSIDLSGYVTTSALNTALAGYTPTSSLATVATSGDYDDLTNTPTIPDGMEILELESETGTLSATEVALATSEHCVIMHAGVCYYKDNDDGETYVYYHNYYGYGDGRGYLCYAYVVINYDEESEEFGEYSFDEDGSYMASVVHANELVMAATPELESINIDGNLYAVRKPSANSPMPKGATGVKLDNLKIPGDNTYYTVPTISTNIASDAYSDIKTASPKAVKTFVEGKEYYKKPNGGIPASDLASGVIPQPEVFWATYGTTTASDIDTAISAGKAVMCYYNDRLYCLSKATQVIIYFGSFYGNSESFLSLLREGDTWAQETIGLEKNSYKVTSWNNTPTDINYPSEKLVKDSIDAVDKVFWATYGTTTFSDLTSAYNAGKIVVVFYNSRLYSVTLVSNTEIGFSAFGFSTNYYLSVSNNDTWATSTVELQRTNQKVTSISSSSTDNQYPSAKCVYDIVGNIETLLAAI